MAKSDKPNILIIWGDDIGYWNISHYSRGMQAVVAAQIEGFNKFPPRQPRYRIMAATPKLGGL